MGGAVVVIALVGLVFPISLLLAALVFDAAVIAWVVADTWYHESWPSWHARYRRWSTALRSHRPHWHLPHHV